MGGFLYTIAVVLVILWAIGYFAYGAGAIIHLLLMIAIIAVLLRVRQGKSLTTIQASFQLLEKCIRFIRSLEIHNKH